MHRGYVRDYRKGIEHTLFSRPLIWHFWVYCRLRANHKSVEIDFNGSPLNIERGCFVMSIGNAVKDTGLSIQNIRTAIKILESHKMIEKSTSEVTKQATIIRVIKFDTYQQTKDEANRVSNEVLTMSQQGPNKVLTTDNNVKKVEKVNKKDIDKPENVTDQTWSDFLVHRKDKKAPITQTVINGFTKQSGLAGMSLENAIIESINRGWRGFKAEWMENKPSKESENKKKRLTTVSQRNEKFFKDFKNEIENSDNNGFTEHPLLEP